jgi:polygalacturonase
MTIKKAVKLFLIGLIASQAFTSNTRATNILATNARNVKDYGAKGDGVTDDTQAFLDALNEGRHSNPTSSYFAPAAIYVPPGTYLIKQTLILWAQTFLFGEWTNPPTLLLAPNSPNFPKFLLAEPFYCHRERV